METRRDLAKRAASDTVAELSSIYDLHIRPILERYTSITGFLVEDLHISLGRFPEIGAVDSYALKRISLSLERHEA